MTISLAALNLNSGFNVFDRTHIIWLVSILLITMIGSIAYNSFSHRQRKVTKYVIAYSLLVFEIIKITVVINEDKNILYYLPIHLCGLAIFLLIIYAHTQNRYVAEILYAITLPGAAIALITPGWANEKLLSFLHVHSFIFHMVIIMFPLMIIVSKEHKPSLRALIAPVSFLAVTVPAVYIFNKWTGTNYMFLNWPISNTPIMTLANWFGEPGYIFGMILVLIVVWILMYIKELGNLIVKK